MLLNENQLFGSCAGSDLQAISLSQFSLVTGFFDGTKENITHIPGLREQQIMYYLE